MRNRREQEGQARRRGSRVFNHQQTVVFGLQKIFKRARDGQIIFDKVGFCVVDAHIAKVDRGQTVFRIKLETGRDICKGRGWVCFENIGF